MIAKRMCFRFLAGSASLLLAGATALAQTAPGGAAQQQPNTPAQQQQMTPGVDNAAAETAMQQNMADRAFVKNALEGGEAEVQLGQLAQQKAQSPEVKQFGQKMVQDHTQLGNQMKPIAQQLGVKEPKGPSKKDQKLIAKLDALSGPQFDNAYILAMVKDHKHDLNDFKEEAQTAQNPNLKQAAQQGSTVIAQHLQIIQQIAQSHNIAEK